MAATTGLRLLHIAAVLVMMASSGGVLAETIFRIDEIEYLMLVLQSRECLPDDFNASQVSELELANFGQCITKVEAGDVPSECVGAKILAQFYNCYATSMGYLVDVGGVQTFDVEALENRVLAFSNDESWTQPLMDRMAYCQEVAPESLTTQQLAAYSYMCIQFSLFALCDGQQDDQGYMDVAALERREHFLQHIMELVLSVLGEGDAVWAKCSQSVDGKLHYRRPHLHAHKDRDAAAQHYANIFSVMACILMEFDDDGVLDIDLFFEEAGPALASAGLEQLETLCNSHDTAEMLTQCIITQGILIMAAHESNLAASSMTDSCTISLL